MKTLSSDKIAVNVKNIADGVVANLSAADSYELTGCFEMEATAATRFEDGEVRAVSENARTLKVDQSAFEES